MTDAIIGFVDAGHNDPDRLMALRITNFLGGMDLRRAVAVYSLAMTMSFRDIDDAGQRVIMRAISEACFKSWAIALGEPEPQRCGNCEGTGTTGTTLETFQTCTICQGTGAA